MTKKYFLDKTIKNKKYDAEWRKWTKGIVGETIETKLSELEAIKDELEQTEEAERKAREAVRHGFGVKRERARLEVITATTLNTRNNNFHNTWKTGWNKLVKDFYKDAGDNIYKFKIGAVEYETTEEQIISAIARAIKALEKVDEADFKEKFNVKVEDAGKRTNAEKAIQGIKKLASEIEDEHGKRTLWDFPNTYEKGKIDDADGIWKKDTSQPNSNPIKYEDFYKAIKELTDANFLDSLDANKQKEVPQTEDWKIFLKGEEYNAEKLKEYGIEISGNTKLYKTGETHHTFKVKNGVKSWISLIQTVLSEDNAKKLDKNFDVSKSPNQILLSEGKIFSPETDNTNIWILPESLEALEKVEEDLEVEKQAWGRKIDKDKTKAEQVKLKAKETEIQTVLNTTLNNKRNELKTLIPDLAKGKEFKKVSDTEDYRKNFTELTKLNILLLEIRYLEKDGDCSVGSSITDENEALDNIIRIKEEILEGRKFDVSDSRQYFPYTRPHLIADYFKKDGKFDEAHGIAEIKKTFASSLPSEVMKFFKEDLEWHNERVKLYDDELKMLNALKKELGENPDSPDIPETLETWQTKLKSLHSDLDNSEITTDFKTSWEATTNFKKVANIETELGKVIDKTDAANPKVKDGFLTVLKATDSKVAGTKINNLKELMSEEPKKVISLIRQFELDSETDSNKKTQRKRRLAVAFGKKSTDTVKTLTAEEEREILWKIAEGIDGKTEGSKNYDANLNEITTPQENQTEQPWLRANNWQVWAVFIGVPLIIGGTALIFYWEQFVQWWNGPVELDGQTSEEGEEKEEESE